ncbi:twin-arginine translocation signal domain-containing protein [Tepidamorphus sp. 3E244]|uniref:twin-arginine translocation signal domain-containing protein n=1 Tax=Tepidamorphus sp. 3E244 TaxID=3385498 RepID=UPI0038FCCEAE
MAGKKEDAKTDRRSFLKLAGLGSVAGGAALVTGAGEAEAAALDTPGNGYRESEHVKAFYQSARF